MILTRGFFSLVISVLPGRTEIQSQPTRIELVEQSTDLAMIEIGKMVLGKVAHSAN
jgi:hypothetical protein